MKTTSLIQGTDEWHAHRANHFNASDAPAMMGVGQKTRSQLLHEMYTGMQRDVSDYVQERVFNPGHRFEELARPLAEKIMGADLYPVTGTDGKLSASFDGITLLEDECFEHKTLNDEIKSAFEQIETIAPEYRDQTAGLELAEMYQIQMEQQLIVSGASRVLFMASKWTDEGELIEERHCWYYPNPTLRQQIIDGWAQFEKDLAAYVPPEAEAPKPVGRTPETLPALRIEVTGMVTASNLDAFKLHALEVIKGINRDLATDQDFADAEKAVKWCGEVESKLAAAKQHALSQTESIDAMFRAVDEISSEARRVRLDLDKLVTRRKSEVKEQAVIAARTALDTHIADLNAELAPMRMQPIAADFAGAIKGLRSIASMQDALDNTLAKSKIAADAAAKLIRTNAAAYREQANGLEFLFSDLGQIITKAPEDFALVLKSRIDVHRAAEAKREADRKAAEEQRLEDERQRIIEAERARAAKIEAERIKREQAEAAQQERIHAELVAKNTTAQDSQQVLKAEPAMAEATEREPLATTSPSVVSMGTGQADDAAPADDPAILKLCDINARLAPVSVSAQTLADLGINHVAIDRAAKLYRESQYPLICDALIKHIQKSKVKS